MSIFYCRSVDFIVIFKILRIWFACSVLVFRISVATDQNGVGACVTKTDKNCRIRLIRTVNGLFVPKFRFELIQEAQPLNNKGSKFKISSSFQGEGVLEDHTVCLRDNVIHSFKVVRDGGGGDQKGQIGALICEEFVQEGETFTFKLANDGRCLKVGASGMLALDALHRSPYGVHKGAVDRFQVLDHTAAYSMAYSYYSYSNAVHHNPSPTPSLAPATSPSSSEAPSSSSAPVAPSPTQLPTTANPTISLSPTQNPSTTHPTISLAPTSFPTLHPTLHPTISFTPTRYPTTAHPTISLSPTQAPSPRPTAHPTISFAPTVNHRPTHCPSAAPYSAVPPTAALATCIGSCPSYSASWESPDYCAFYISSGCSYYSTATPAKGWPASVFNYSCVPACLNSTACASAYCTEFAYLSLTCSTTPAYTVALYDTITAGCMSSFLTKRFASLNYLQFNLTVIMPGISAASLQASESALTALRSAVARTLSGVYLDDLTIVSIYNKIIGSTATALVRDEEGGEEAWSRKRISDDEADEAQSRLQPLEKSSQNKQQSASHQWILNKHHQQSSNQQAGTGSRGSDRGRSLTQLEDRAIDRVEDGGDSDRIWGEQGIEQVVPSTRIIRNKDQQYKGVETISSSASTATTEAVVVLKVRVSLQSLGYAYSADSVTIAQSVAAAYQQLATALSSAVSSGSLLSTLQEAAASYGTSSALLLSLAGVTGLLAAMSAYSVSTSATGPTASPVSVFSAGTTSPGTNTTAVVIGVVVAVGVLASVVGVVTVGVVYGEDFWGPAVPRKGNKRLIRAPLAMPLDTNIPEPPSKF